jgi:predicted secreted acid phosphatase
MLFLLFYIYGRCGNGPETAGLYIFYIHNRAFIMPVSLTLKNLEKNGSPSLPSAMLCFNMKRRPDREAISRC